MLPPLVRIYKYREFASLVRLRDCMARCQPSVAVQPVRANHEHCQGNTQLAPFVARVISTFNVTCSVPPEQKL
jgi:hypothetical protein